MVDGGIVATAECIRRICTRLVCFFVFCFFFFVVLLLFRHDTDQAQSTMSPSLTP